MTLRKRRFILLFSTLTFVILATFAISYSNGYMFDHTLRLTQRGGLYVSVATPDSRIFVNNKEEKTTGMLNNGLFLSNLKPGEHSILVAKDNFWPWAKKLKITEGLVTEARAIMIPQNPKGEIVFKGKFSKIWSSPSKKLLILEETNNNVRSLSFYLPEENMFLTPISSFSEQLLSFKEEISDLILEKNYLIFTSEKGVIKTTMDTENKTVKASYLSEKIETETSDFIRHTTRKDQKLWWNPKTNEVFMDWLDKKKQPPYFMCAENSCKMPIKIFQSQFEIKNVDFFPGRKDVIVIAVNTGIYALEIDSRGGRLVYPIYKGKDPSFATLIEKNSIYVIDGGSLFKIYIE